MAHTSLFDQLLRSMRLARYCDRRGISTSEGLARRRQAEEVNRSRRQFLGGLGAVAATGVVGGLASACAADGSSESTGSVGQRLTHTGSLDVGIVGAGLAGLSCADQLRLNGVTATVYEGNTRVGGRQYSLSGFFPGQVVEMGGELIDTSQKNMINYARAFGCTLEDYLKSPGDVFYYINGQAYPESDIVDSYRAFVAAQVKDLQGVSPAPTADTHNDYDVMIDNMSIAQYVSSRGADPLLSAVVQAAYVGEYGTEIDNQSALNFLLYIRADRRSKFQPFGTSDQRFHIVEGNDSISKGLAARLAGQIQMGMALVRVAQTAAGRVELTFKSGNKTIVKTHDIAVIAIPFTVLRTLDLDASLGLPAWKTQAIQQMGYGSNSKNMVGFNGRPWAAAGCNGMAYATLPNIQNCWETSWTTATATSAVMTNFTGGNLGASQDPSKIQAQTAAFLADFEKVFPGGSALATRDAKGNYHAAMMAWPTNPWSLGSYSSYRPGQFTSIAGNEGKAIGNLHFAGEHCDSFYDQQGFMEGALISGAATAAEILAAAQKAA
jgi:monoamine oxidase